MESIKELVIVFVGGGLGSGLRYIIGKYLNQIAFHIPYGTLTVNLLGSLIIGIIFGLASKNINFSNTTSLLMATGFCGGFTTFSTFALENLKLIQDGDFIWFLLYTLFSIGMGIAMVFIGIWLVK